jgi:hypothetical protein
VLTYRVVAPLLVHPLMCVSLVVDEMRLNTSVLTLFLLALIRLLILQPGVQLDPPKMQSFWMIQMERTSVQAPGPSAVWQSRVPVQVPLRGLEGCIHHL